MAHTMMQLQRQNASALHYIASAFVKKNTGEELPPQAPPSNMLPPGFAVPSDSGNPSHSEDPESDSCDNDNDGSE